MVSYVPWYVMVLCRLPTGGEGLGAVMTDGPRFASEGYQIAPTTQTFGLVRAMHARSPAGALGVFDVSVPLADVWTVCTYVHKYGRTGGGEGWVLLAVSVSRAALRHGGVRWSACK